jgi:hypothetical protein
LSTGKLSPSSVLANFDVFALSRRSFSVIKYIAQQLIKQFVRWYYNILFSNASKALRKQKLAHKEKQCFAPIGLLKGRIPEVVLKKSQLAWMYKQIMYVSTADKL